MAGTEGEDVTAFQLLPVFRKGIPWTPSGSPEKSLVNKEGLLCIDTLR